MKAIDSENLHQVPEDVRYQHADDKGFMSVIILHHSIKNNLFTAYQKVYRDGQYVGYRIKTFVYFDEIQLDDKFHFDPLELQYAVQLAQQHHDKNFIYYVQSLDSFLKD